MSLSSRDSYEETLSSTSSHLEGWSDAGSLDGDSDDDSGDQNAYAEFLRSFQERPERHRQAAELIRTADIQQQGRSELIDVLKIHNGLSSCSMCRSRIVMGDIRIDYRPRLPSGQIKHVHFGCMDDNRDLYYPRQENIRFDPQFSDSEKRSLDEQMRRRLTEEPTEFIDRNRLYPLVRPGDPDRRIQRQRDFLNQDMRARANTQTRVFDRIMEHRGYIDSRRAALESYRMDMRYIQPSIPQSSFSAGGLALGILQSLPRFVLQPTSHVSTPQEPGAPRDVATTEESDDNCVICLENMEPGQTIVILPCFHRFHAECVDSWLKGSKLCPIDKLDIEQLVHRSGDSQNIPPFLRDTPQFRQQSASSFQF